MNKIPLQPFTQLTPAEIHLALREIQFGGACTLWINATETVSGLMPSDWRDFDAEKFQMTVKDIWDDVKKEVTRAFGAEGVKALYVLRTAETQPIVDECTRREISERVGIIGKVMREEVMEVAKKWRNCDMMVLFAGSARRCGFVTFIRGRDQESVARMPRCRIRE